mgnify:FL=1
MGSTLAPASGRYLAPGNFKETQVKMLCNSSQAIRMILRPPAYRSLKELSRKSQYV